MRLFDLCAYLARYLRVAEVPDGQPNGLHVEGRPEVRRLVTGVSACEELFQRGVEAGADAILTHHGLLWGQGQAVVAGPHKRRLKLLLDHDVSLLSYHLPLDLHEEVGNNAVAARDLGLRDLQPFGTFGSLRIGVAGTLPEPVPRAELVRRLAQYYGRAPLVFPYGPDPVRRIGVVSGSGQDALGEAAQEGLDLLVTGEVREQTLHAAKELGVGFASCGHHATERVGVKALGAHLEQRHGIAHAFVDVANPV